jgi:dolichol-phosphate mannosyltransferase
MSEAERSSPDLSVVIPAWNEEGNIARVVTDARKAALDLDLSCEVLVMDGDSEDQTREEASKAGARSIIERGGFAESLRRGFREAKAPWILVVDGDGSHPLDRFSELWKNRDGVDIVVGSRLVAGGGLTLPGWRNALTRVLNFFFRRVMGAPVADSSSGYRLYRAEKVKGIDGGSHGFEFQQETLLEVVRGGGKAVEVPIHYRWRESGESKARVLALGWGYVKTVLRFWFGGRRS